MKDLSTLSGQEVRQHLFDVACTHLLKQGKKSMGVVISNDWDAEYIDDDTPQCVYRSEDGLQCAVGCLISDEHYQKTLEGNKAGYARAAVCKSFNCNEADVPIHFLMSIQEVHDHGEVSEWGARLLELANKLDLSNAIPLEWVKNNPPR